MKTKLTVIISLCIASGFAYGQERSSIENDEQKIKLIKENPDKYENGGGVISDNLSRVPDKNKPIIGDGFIIHSIPSEDFEIHSLNKISDQRTDEFRETKTQTLEYLEKKFDGRVMATQEEPYRSPNQRNTNK